MKARLMIDFASREALLEWLEDARESGMFDAVGREREDVGARAVDALDLLRGTGEGKREDYILRDRSQGGTFLGDVDKVDEVDHAALALDKLAAELQHGFPYGT